MMRLLGASPPAAYLVQGVSAISAAIAVATLWRGSGPLGIKSAGLVVATFLATPYAWDYDMMILIFAAAWLADDGLRNGFRPWEKTTVLVLLVLPLISLISAKLLDLQIAPIPAVDVIGGHHAARPEPGFCFGNRIPRRLPGRMPRSSGP